MNKTDARVRKCKNVSILIDKRMRECRIEHDKYIYNARREDEPVKIMGKN